jgi:hypothetical protein
MLSPRHRSVRLPQYREAQSNHTTVVHFATQPCRNVSLSAAKNLTARPFAEFILSEAEGLRVTDLLCQSFMV